MAVKIIMAHPVYFRKNVKLLGTRKHLLRGYFFSPCRAVKENNIVERETSSKNVPFKQMTSRNFSDTRTGVIMESRMDGQTEVEFEIVFQIFFI